MLFISLITARRSLLNLFDPVSYFSITHIVLFFLAAFYRGFYEWGVPINDQSLILLCSCMLAFAIGATVPGGLLSALSKRLFPKQSAMKQSALYAVASTPRYYSYSAWILFMFGAAGVAIFIIKCGGILWLKNDFDDLRITARAGIGWLVLPSIVFITYSTIALFSYYLFHKQQYMKSYAVALLGTFLLLQYGNRAPAFEVVICCGFIYCWKRWRTIPVLLMLVGCLLTFLTLGAMQVIRQGLSTDFLMVLLQSIWRPFVNIQNFDLIVKAFPNRLNFLHGQSFFMDLAVLAPGYQPNFGTWLKDQLGLDFTGGSVTVTYLGELYANFGEVGGLWGAFLLGTVLDVLSRYSRKFYDDYTCYPTIFAIAITSKAVVSSGFISPILYIMIPFIIYRLAFSQILHLHELLFTDNRVNL